MSSSNDKPSDRVSRDKGLVTLTASSVAMILLTFAVAGSDLPAAYKYGTLVPAALVYIALAALSFRLGSAGAERLGVPLPATSEAVSETDAKLASLSDANEFFGASLRPDDLFRLITSRLAEIVPFATCVLYMREPMDGPLNLKCVAGDGAAGFAAEMGTVDRSLASRAAASGGIEKDPELEIERAALGGEALKGLASAVAAPLALDGVVYGAMVLYSGRPDDFDAAQVKNFEAAAERISPLIASSFAFERSVNNALTDFVTSLPNERGFFLVLESQIAESHRFRDVRPLTVLAMDVSGFGDFNAAHGHSTGNRLLAHVAAVVKAQLRQMDVLTRSAGDEFLVILPTANEVVSDDIAGRIRRAVKAAPFASHDEGEFELSLNFGSATFWRDGETAQALLQVARLRKQESKSQDGKVLFFPRDNGN